jgi:uncharacterized protein YbjT (DUF2867 family)
MVGAETNEMTDQQVVLITGATGQQGGAVFRHLAGRGFRLRAMTRKPDGDKARALAAEGADVVAGDLDDESSLKAALTGVWGVFGVQNTWEAGVQKEEEQGHRLATMAKAAGVQHYVYTSVGSAERNTGIPHFDNKWRVEQTLRALAFPSHVIIRPVFFMENLASPWFLNGDTVTGGLRPETTLQMVAVDDIGRVGARAFTDAAALDRREIEIAGDALTLPAATAVMARALGRPLNYVQVPISDIRKNSEEFAIMLEWFERVGYNADIPALDREFGRMTKLEDWAGKTLSKR